MWIATLVAVGSANVKHSLGKLLGQSGPSFAEDITTEMYEQKKCGSKPLACSYYGLSPVKLMQGSSWV